MSCAQREPALAAPCPARARPMCCLPTVPLCPQGRRRWKAHGARGQAPALTLTLPAPPFPEAANLAFSPLPGAFRADSHPLLLLLWGIWVQPRVGGLSAHLLPPRILSPGPLAQLLPAKKTNLGLYLRSHVPCAVSRLSLLCPAFQLVFKSLGCPLGCPPPLPGSPLVSCQAFCKEKPLGEKTERTKK